jgi:glycosyltransferase involved in cell wall biosynthesis
MWHAASQIDAESFRAAFPRELSDPVFIAPDLPFIPHIQLGSIIEKRAGHLKLAFLGRIAREKNLHFALQLLHQATDEVEYDIYGPIDNEGYWQTCQHMIADLPATVRVTHHGAIAPDQVLPMLRQHHALLFPVRGESFSWTIFEALLAGCPVIISDQTPWQDLDAHYCGWVIPLDQPDRFVACLNDLLSMDQATFERHSLAASAYAQQYLRDNDPLAASRQMFRVVLTRAIP